MPLGIYIGAHYGGGLNSLISKCNKIIAFEPIPELYEILKRNYESSNIVEVINAAVYNYDGITTFNVLDRDFSSSLGRIVPYEEAVLINPETPWREISTVNRTIQTSVINLARLLKERNIDIIDYYISDAQGSDLAILQTLKPWVENQNIGEIFVETLDDEHPIIYSGLVNNYLSSFKQLLEPYYKISYYSWDGHISDTKPEGKPEYDVCWRINE